MRVDRTKPGGAVPYENTVDLVNSAGNIDYIQDGILYENSTVKAVQVESSDDLAGIASRYETGTIAYTAGFAKMWQMSSSRTWVEV